MSIFVQNGVTCEIVMFLLSVMMVFFIIVSKPKKTMMLKITYGGFCLSMVTIVLNLTLFVMSEYPGIFPKPVFYLVYVLFVSCYNGVLLLIFTYIDLLSYTRRSQIPMLRKMLLVFSIVNMLIMLAPAFMGMLFEFTPEKIAILPGYNAYIICGLLDAALSLLTILFNRKSISPIVSVCSIIFITLDMCVLSAQFFCDTAVFTSATYVVAFIIFFVLFHCDTFDEISGCQCGDSFFVRLDDAISQKKRFITLTVIFPALQKRDFYETQALKDYCSSSICRQIERNLPGISLYSHNDYTYSCFLLDDRSDTAEQIMSVVNAALSKPIFFQGSRVDARFKMIVVRDNLRFKCADNVRSVIAYEKSRFLPNLENEIIEVDDEELGRVAKKDIIEQQLFDIRNNMDYNDPRIVCFAQPIYCIETGTFRSAEALMRLNIDGELIYPDSYISIAEGNGTIHVLTLIMLNKVCQFVKSIEKSHDFDAITVNCSTVEMDDRNLHKELADIITKNNVDPKKIRIEITESVDFAHYDNVLYNMEMLKKFGVDFYLDDFGTGYSNLERIVSYPFHTIKFDKNILYRALGDKKADAVLDSTVKLFRENGFSTVVEGVEDESQTAYAKEKGFSYIQGYMYSKPIDIGELSNFFQRIEE